MRLMSQYPWLLHRFTCNGTSAQQNALVKKRENDNLKISWNLLCHHVQVLKNLSWCQNNVVVVVFGPWVNWAQTWAWFKLILTFYNKPPMKPMNGSLEVPILSDQTDKYHWKSDQMFTGKWMKWRKWQPETILISNLQLFTISSSKENVFTSLLFPTFMSCGIANMSGASALICFNPLSCCLRCMTTLFILFINKHDFCWLRINFTVWVSQCLCFLNVKFCLER